jgi:hypothetical protein
MMIIVNNKNKNNEIEEQYGGNHSDFTTKSLFWGLDNLRSKRDGIQTYLSSGPAWSLQWLLLPPSRKELGKSMSRPSAPAIVASVQCSSGLAGGGGSFHAFHKLTTFHRYFAAALETG